MSAAATSGSFIWATCTRCGGSGWATWWYGHWSWARATGPCPDCRGAGGRLCASHTFGTSANTAASPPPVSWPLPCADKEGNTAP